VFGCLEKENYNNLKISLSNLLFAFHFLMKIRSFFIFIFFSSYFFTD